MSEDAWECGWRVESMSIHTPKAEKMDARRDPSKVGVSDHMRSKSLPGTQIGPGIEESRSIPQMPPSEDYIGRIYEGANVCT